jgi:Family of unknown function (DUF6165)
MAVTIQTSWGELLDKITILQIKTEKITDAGKKVNVDRELAELLSVMDKAGPLADEVIAVMEELRDANARLWDIEDDIRCCEREQRFDEEFIRLARAVYITNDRRAELKKRINMLLDSDLVEEKSYESYS